MSFLNGFKNIKTISIVNIFFFLILSTIFFIILINEKKAQVSFWCFNDDQNKIFKNDIIFIEHVKICENFKTKIDDNYKNISGISNNLVIKFLEPDNYNYKNNFLKLNELYFEKLKILNKLKKNSVNIKKLSNEISLSLREVKFFNYKYTGSQNFIFSENREKFKIDILKLQNLEYLKKTQIGEIEFLNIYSVLYTKLFPSNKYAFVFINILNLIFFITVFILTYLILKEFLNNKIKNIKLISLSIILIPINSIYFLDFYKEPVILIVFLILIFNFNFIIKNQQKLIYTSLLSTLLILSSLIILSEVKSDLLDLLLIGIFISYFVLFFGLKSKKIKFIFVIKILLITHFSTNLVNLNNLFPHKITNNRTAIVFTEYFKDIKKIFINKKEKTDLLINIEKSENLVSKTLENINKKEMEDKIYIDNLINQRNYEKLSCINKLKFFCDILDNKAFLIVNLKESFLLENQENIFNSNLKYLYNTKKILISLFISAPKSFFAPIDFSDTIKSSLSIYKILLFYFFISFILLNYKFLPVSVIASLLLFFPYLVIINFISTNTFTHFRYLYPYNYFISMLGIIGFIYLIFLKKIK